jgi:hypothetical protein
MQVSGKLVSMMPAAEQNLLNQALRMLQDLFTDDGLTIGPYLGNASDSGSDATWELKAPNHSALLLVMAYRRFAPPRDVDHLLGKLSLARRAAPVSPVVVVVAPWLSPRSRDLLTEGGVSYVDLTGNIRLRVPRPTVHLRLEGASRDPDPPAKPPVRFQGRGVNALVRVLVDVAPPYRMVELARASGLSNGYVSRTLEALYEQRLIDRAPHSKVVADVDWEGLLRARAEHYRLLTSNHGGGYLHRAGASDLHQRLDQLDDGQPVVTGSFAVTEFVRVAAPTQLTVYVTDPAGFARRHGLLPTGQGANVVLLRPADPSQLAGTRQVGGVSHVGVSQLAMDCLGGNGRLLEEGAALLDWMADNTPLWRLDHLPESH